MAMNLLTVPDIEAKIDELEQRVAEHRRVFDRLHLDSTEQWDEIERELKELREELRQIVTAA
jgi:uncharacterized coiled-coil protein SlyX